MFYVISITGEHAVEQMCGPGDWSQCVQKGAQMIEAMLGKQPTADDLECFEDDGLWTKEKHSVDGVYIIQCDPFE